MLTKNDVGKRIIMFREPTSEEWIGCGKVPITHLLEKEVIFKNFGSNEKNIFVIDGTHYVYPSCCFKLFEETPNYEVY